MPSAQPSATSAPAAGARTTRAGPDRGAPVVVLVLLALTAAGGTLTFVGIRRRRESEPDAAAVPLPPTAVEAGHVVPALWHGRSGRFSRAVTRTTATVAATQERGGGGPSAGADPPVRDGAAAPAAGKPSPVTPVVAAAPAGSPPDRRLAWAAEIEWRQIDGESRFCVMARGAGTVAVAQSPPLEWPPSGPAAVQAITDAAEDLAATLAAAGWKALPPGRAWYAKRFAWEPVAAEPAEAVASPSPATPPTAPGRSRRSRWKQVALLSVLAVLGLIAALQVGGGSDGAPAGRSTTTPVTQAPGTPAVEPTAARKPEASDGIDLSVPLLVILGLPLLVLMIRQTRRALR